MQTVMSLCFPQYYDACSLCGHLRPWQAYTLHHNHIQRRFRLSYTDGKNGYIISHRRWSFRTRRIRMHLLMDNKKPSKNVWRSFFRTARIFRRKKSSGENESAWRGSKTMESTRHIVLTVDFYHMVLLCLTNKLLSALNKFKGNFADARWCWKNHIASGNPSDSPSAIALT